jgi:hypothetical protein
MRVAPVFAIGCILLAPLAQAQMYKCVDANGKSSYADKPGPGCKQVDIHGSPPISGKLQAPRSDSAGDEAAFRRRQIEREKADETEQRTHDAQTRRCAGLREELARLNNGRKLVEKTTDAGERIYMDDQTREQKIAQANAGLSGCP